MDDFTAAFPYSSRHLTRLFREDLGLTMFEYLRLYRILMASIALSDESRTITQCAVDAGYGPSPHFIMISGRSMGSVQRFSGSGFSGPKRTETTTPKGPV